MDQYMAHTKIIFPLKSSINNTQQKQILSEIFILLKKNYSKLITIDEKIISSEQPTIFLSKKDIISFSISKNSFTITLSLTNKKFYNSSQKMINEIHTSLTKIKFLKLMTLNVQATYEEKAGFDLPNLFNKNILSEYEQKLPFKLVPVSVIFRTKLDTWNITCMPFRVPKKRGGTSTRKYTVMTLIVITKSFNTTKNLLKEVNTTVRTLQQNFKNLKTVKKV